MGRLIVQRSIESFSEDYWYRVLVSCRFNSIAKPPATPGRMEKAML